MSKHINGNVIRRQILDCTSAMNVLCSKPLLHLYSDKEIVVEGANNLDYYDDNSVRISAERMMLEITGRHLYIKCLANRNLSISGVIENIKFEHQKK